MSFFVEEKEASRECKLCFRVVPESEMQKINWKLSFLCLECGRRIGNKAYAKAVYEANIACTPKEVTITPLESLNLSKKKGK